MAEERFDREDILRRVRKLHAQQIKWRRRLHQFPELSLKEHQTTAFLSDELRKRKLKFLPLKMETGVLAELTGSRPGRTVAIRSDIDALPITEKSGVPFSSKHPGVMHACGHDAHMATVLGAAAILAEMRTDLRGSVRFIFQPAEEQPPGGARPMIANGALKNVDVIFGLHVDPHLPTGKISLRDGPTMASVYDFDIVVHGKSGHAARPHSAVDAVSIAAEIVEAVQKIVSRELNPISPAAVTFGTISGGTARNVIADRAVISGTARALDKDVARRLPRLIKRTVAGVCRARGAKYDVIEVAGYPLLVNDPSVNRLLERNFHALFGPRPVPQTELMLAGEDFGCYLEKVPGAMFRLGIRNKKIRADKPWHSSEFIIDEAAMVYGTALLVAATLDYLGSQTE